MKLRIGYVSRNQTMTSPNPIVRTLIAALLGATVTGGCGGSASPKQEPEPEVNPLSAMVGRPLVILPTQFLAFSTSSGEWESSADNPALLIAPDLIGERITIGGRDFRQRSALVFAGREARRLSQLRILNRVGIPPERQLMPGVSNGTSLREGERCDRRSSGESKERRNTRRPCN